MTVRCFIGAEGFVGGGGVADWFFEPESARLRVPFGFTRPVP